jgi:hypothetical protein
MHAQKISAKPTRATLKILQIQQNYHQNDRIKTANPEVPNKSSKKPHPLLYFEFRPRDVCAGYDPVDHVLNMLQVVVERPEARKVRARAVVDRGQPLPNPKLGGKVRVGALHPWLWLWLSMAPLYCFFFFFFFFFFLEKWNFFAIVGPFFFFGYGTGDLRASVG